MLKKEKVLLMPTLVLQINQALVKKIYIKCLLLTLLEDKCEIYEYVPTFA